METKFMEYLKANLNFEPKKVLDLGCNIFSKSIEIVKEFHSVKKIDAVDNDKGGIMLEYFESKKIQNLSVLEDISKNGGIAHHGYWDEVPKNMINKIDFNYSSIEDFCNQSDEKYDFIILSNVFHFYHDKNERKKLLKSIFERLEDEGAIYIEVISELNKNTKLDWWKDKFPFTVDSIKSEMKAAGFSNRIELKYVGGYDRIQLLAWK